MRRWSQVLQGKMLVQIHCYRSDEFLTEIAIANEFGYKIRAFHHALEAYKVPEALAQNNIAIATFADWWGYKYEAWDAIPWNAVMAMRAGVKVAIKSDSDDFMRRLNQEAAKTMRYGGATEDEAMQMLTINPAWIMGIDDKTGSIDVGKDADLVLWERLSTVELRGPREGLDRRGCVLRSRAARTRHAAIPGGTVMKTALKLLAHLVSAGRATAGAQQKSSTPTKPVPTATTPAIDPNQARRYYRRQVADNHARHHRKRRGGDRQRARLRLSAPRRR